ncbi:hypothetical protein [Sphingomonas aerolata]|uniref:hypothetical protein n=1 Tax=Sphingomonas aerolata TaxID=185951 RepID=UPI003364E904
MNDPSGQPRHHFFGRERLCDRGGSLGSPLEHSVRARARRGLDLSLQWPRPDALAVGRLRCVGNGMAGERRVLRRTKADGRMSGSDLVTVETFGAFELKLN